MNKLTIGFIIFLAIMIIIFSYFSVTRTNMENFVVMNILNRYSRKTTPCYNLSDDNCEANTSCPLVNDTSCKLQDSKKCEIINPMATNSSGNLCEDTAGCELQDPIGCQNKCAYIITEESCGNTDNCSWSEGENKCLRTVEATCGSKDDETACEGDNNCEYNSSFSFCSPKIEVSSCEGGQEFTTDNNNFTQCEDCRAGYFSRNGVRCMKCGVNGDMPSNMPGDESGNNERDYAIAPISGPKATACVDRAEFCGESEYENLGSLPDGLEQELIDMIPIITHPVDETLPSDVVLPPSEEQSRDIYLNRFKYKLSNKKGTDRDCRTLQKCDLADKYVTNFGDIYNMYIPDTDARNLRYSPYECEDLTECDSSQYISNYDNMEQRRHAHEAPRYFGSGDQTRPAINMYREDRICTDLTSCEAGNYVSNELDKDIHSNLFYTNDRVCGGCGDDTYTDEPNMTGCIDQPYCELGERVKSEYAASQSADGDVPTLVKDNRLECEACDDYEYQDEVARAFACNPQSTCQAGRYYTEDDMAASKLYQVGCEECACDTYQDKAGFITECKNQPMVTSPGSGVSEEYPGCDLQNLDFKGNKIDISTCDGAINYQDTQSNHREQCKPHIYCGKGEIITEDTPITTRQCTTLPVYTQEECKKSDSNCRYTDQDAHRLKEGLRQPVCTNSVLTPQITLCSQDSDPRNLVKYRANCRTPSEKLAFALCPADTNTSI